jgi:hypothetical protein
MDPAVSWESLFVGAAWNAAGKANAEAAALEHYYTS